VANKTNGRSWNDIQLMLASTSVALTLSFWNLFAGPDREAAVLQAQQKAAEDAMLQAELAASQPAAPAPSGESSTKLLLGGQAPQTQVVVGGRGGRGGGGGGGGGGAAASTRSS